MFSKNNKKIPSQQNEDTHAEVTHDTQGVLK
jgi:hypothetical protein